MRTIAGLVLALSLVACGATTQSKSQTTAPNGIVNGHGPIPAANGRAVVVQQPKWTGDADGRGVVRPRQ